MAENQNQYTVTVLATKTNSKYKDLVVNGNTLSALKAALRELQCDYTGMAFFEGITRSELIDDNSTFQNGAVFRLTPNEKRVTSGEGMSRNEAFDYIRKHHLEDAVKEANDNHRNFTNMGTAWLLDFIEKDKAAKAPKATKAAPVVAPKTEPAPAPAPAAPAQKVSADKAMTRQEWLDYGLANNFIDPATAKKLFAGLTVSTISSEDESMFSFVKKK